MVEPLTVWKVELSSGNVHEDIEGILTLGEQALEFEPAEDEAAGPSAIPLSSIAGVKRLRLSPVLLVRWRDRDQLVETAYYLAKPPPLGAGASSPAAPASAIDARRERRAFRTRKRRNSYYLTSMGVEAKPTLIAWVAEIRSQQSLSEGP
jgi:hypothetical protein